MNGTLPAIQVRSDLPWLSRAVRGLWRVADPRISLASVASLLLATCVAARDADIAWTWLALTWLGVFCVEVAKNASGEVFDLDTDRQVTAAERSPFSGGKRVIVDGLLSPKETMAVAAAFYSAAMLCGIVIALYREPAVLWLGITGMAVAYFYNAPPLRLAYRGLGELAVAFTYGPLIASGTYLVQTGATSSALVYLSCLLGVLIAAFLFINEFPDYHADRASAKRNWVVRLGRQHASAVYGYLVAVPFLALGAAAVWFGRYEWLAGFAGAPFAWFAFERLRRYYDDTPSVIAAQAWTLLAFCSFSLGLSIATLAVA